MNAVLNVADALERIGDDAELLKELAEIFLEECPNLRGEIQAAMSASDAAALDRAAHTLKGSAANIGGEGVRAAALRLEEIGRSGDLAGAPEALAALDAEIPKLEEAIAAWSRGAAA